MAIMVPELPVLGLAQASAVEEPDVRCACATVFLITSASVLSMPSFLTGFETEPVTSVASLSRLASFEPAREQEATVMHKQETAINLKGVVNRFFEGVTDFDASLESLHWLMVVIPL